MTVGEVLGVDGWKDGWVAAIVSGRDIEWRAYRQPSNSPRDAFARLLSDHPGATIAVDMPIGTTEGPRSTDDAARAWLRERGGPWQSIFSSPTTSVVEAFERGATHGEAMAARRPGTPGTSIQAWNLIAKIVEVRDALADRRDARVIEAHPECSLRLLDPSIGRISKKTGRGAGLRLRALGRVLDVDLAEAPPDVPVDDLLDACAIAWTARRYAAGIHITLPDGATAGPRIVV